MSVKSHMKLGLVQYRPLISVHNPYGVMGHPGHDIPGPIGIITAAHPRDDIKCGDMVFARFDAFRGFPADRIGPEQLFEASDIATEFRSGGKKIAPKTLGLARGTVRAKIVRNHGEMRKKLTQHQNHNRMVIDWRNDVEPMGNWIHYKPIEDDRVEKVEGDLRYLSSGLIVPGRIGKNQIPVVAEITNLAPGVNSDFDEQVFRKGMKVMLKKIPGGGPLPYTGGEELHDTPVTSVRAIWDEEKNYWVAAPGYAMIRPIAPDVEEVEEHSTIGEDGLVDLKSKTKIKSVKLEGIQTRLAITASISYKIGIVVSMGKRALNSDRLPEYFKEKAVVQISNFNPDGGVWVDCDHWKEGEQDMILVNQNSVKSVVARGTWSAIIPPGTPGSDLGFQIGIFGKD